MNTTEKVIAIVLEEVNGYTKEEAEKYAKDCENSTTWVRIDNEIDNLIIKTKREENKR
jgi:hypothetical protein